LLAILGAVAVLAGAQAIAPNSARALQTDNCTDAYGFAVPCQDAGGESGADGGGAQDAGTADGGSTKGDAGTQDGDSAKAAEGDSPSDESRDDLLRFLPNDDDPPAHAGQPQNPTVPTWTGTGQGDYSGITPLPNWKLWTATNVMCPRLSPQLLDLNADMNDGLDSLELVLKAIDRIKRKQKEEQPGHPSDKDEVEELKELREEAEEMRHQLLWQSRKRSRATYQWNFWDCDSALGAGGD
jgi:hypothetical protein